MISTLRFTSLTLPSPFHYVRSLRTLESTAKKSSLFIQSFFKCGLNDKYCGPHSLATLLDIQPSSTENLVRYFDIDKIKQRGTKVGDLTDAIEEITGKPTYTEFPTESRIHKLFERDTPFLALIPNRLIPKENHWVTVVGQNAVNYRYLDYGRFVSIPKDEFHAKCPVIIYSE